MFPLVNCYVRGKPVASTPEELIRQQILKHLVTPLGYPKSCLAVEVSLSDLPHLKGKKVPRRRADILCYQPVLLTPLLLIEVKATPLGRAALQQLIGYNYYVQAPYLAMANGEQVLFAFLQEEKWVSLPYIPPFDANSRTLLIPS